MIPPIELKAPDAIGDALLMEKSVKGKIAKGFLNYAGLFLLILIVLVAIVALTTNISIDSFVDLAGIGLSMFIVIFCSYFAYLCCCDSGTRAGLSTSLYQETIQAFEAVKQGVMTSAYQGRMAEFCLFFVNCELKSTRERIVAEVGISYENYLSAYIGKDKKQIYAIKELSKAQKKAICVANKAKTIRLTPEMILQRGRSAHRRAPLGVSPERKKKMTHAAKFVQTSLSSIVMGCMTFEVIGRPTLETFVFVFVKILLIILSGFLGYKYGLENIVIDTVNYVDQQTDLIQQEIRYVDEHPLVIDHEKKQE